jgi:hypothetical protein
MLSKTIAAKGEVERFLGTKPLSRSRVKLDRTTAQQFRQLLTNGLTFAAPGSKARGSG